MTTKQAKIYNDKSKNLGLPVYVWPTYTKWVWSLQVPSCWPPNYYLFSGDKTGERWEYDPMTSNLKMTFKKQI